ncbi:MAG: hypothetical protein FWC93_03400 [Defluviitaleaceae bacterium]|nr:hypothetical protein [Defluviitaleaceae bacterium]
MHFDLCTIDWTAISSIVAGLVAILTLCAIIAAFRANKTSKAALAEMIYQREQSERALVIIAFDANFDNKTLYFTITNQGTRHAGKVSITFDSDFVRAVGQKSEKVSLERAQRFQKKLELFMRSQFDLAPQQSRKIYFAKLGSYVLYRDNDVHITYSYEWRKPDGKLDSDADSLAMNLSNYHWVSDIQINKGRQPIDRIANSLERIEKNVRYKNNADC